ncbi:hypothetical protein K492DRAFT_175408, partial [Lichtheimia hyalospora FSU 10163]
TALGLTTTRFIIVGFIILSIGLAPLYRYWHWQWYWSIGHQVCALFHRIGSQPEVSHSWCHYHYPGSIKYHQASSNMLFKFLRPSSIHQL